MTESTLHIINHTHWDREWFLSCIYTTHWIPGLVDKLLDIAEANPEFRYLLDGQTLIIEDLLAEYPDYRPKVEKLIRNGNLTIGPYYCQPDWQLTSGELLIRNLEYGFNDAAAFGDPHSDDVMRMGWMVDNFGHLSQAPQLHQQMGIDAVYVWRGVPQFDPYINWQGADGTEMLAINLIGGYRNLYGIAHAPEVVAQRVHSEVHKLQPFYPTPDLPLFDGYDLEDNPEDSVTYLSEHDSGIAGEYAMLEATPATFAAAVRPKLGELPTIVGELNSGKYAATFPGIYSARTYLKLMSHDCALLLHRVAEPMATLAWLRGADYAADRYEAWDRLLLQNSVHDCICGVGIDQVHEKMEDIYRKVFDGAAADCERSIQHILGDFAVGTYAVSTNPFAYAEQVLVDGKQAYRGDVGGIGVWPVEPVAADEPTHETVGSVTLANASWRFEITERGEILLNGNPLYFVLREEGGDTYSDETGEPLVRLAVDSQLDLTRAAHASHVAFRCAATHGEIDVAAKVTVTINERELLKWQIALDSRGVNFRLDLVYEAGVAGRIFAGMPFDTVARKAIDVELLPRECEPALKNILLGQREIGRVTTFPFQEYVALADDEQTLACFAKGLQSYSVTPEGALSLTLRRSVEWLTAGNLAYRLGDAGPFFYVPDARCEREVVHEIAFAIGDFDPQGMALQRMNASFQNPPMLVTVTGDGPRREWSVYADDVPASTLRVREDAVELRRFNPTIEHVGSLWPKQIAKQQVDLQKLPLDTTSTTQVLHSPPWRIGANQGLPRAEGIAELEKRVAAAKAEMEAAQARLVDATGNERHLAQHQVYIHHREMLEYQLSARLNEVKLAQNGALTEAYLYEPDPVVTEVGYELNQLRIKRRIYDYVAAALAE